jgi:two-component sensor histidine kinase/cbb3-type cytochrome oxidase subunit 3
MAFASVTFTIARAIRATAERLTLWADAISPDAKMQHQRAALEAQLRMAAAQEERNRLARDLHDTIKQQLFSINVAAATAQSLRERDPEAAAEHIQQVRTLAQAASVEMKALLTQLRPQPLATVGLVGAIEEQLDALRFRSEVHTEFTHDPLPDETQLPIEAQEAIFRVVQEALANVARHARAKNVAVNVKRRPSDSTPESLYISVSDDGQGFDLENARIGMGMSNMRARVAEVGGTFDVQSAPHLGTAVTIGMPLQQTQTAYAAAQRAKEERYQLVNWASALGGFAFGFIIALAGIFAATFLVGPGSTNTRTVFVLVLAIGSALTLPIFFASISYRRRASANDESGIWRLLLRYHDTGQISVLLTMGAFVTLTFREFAVAAGVCAIAIIFYAINWRAYQQLNRRIAAWATVRGLQARLNEQMIFLGFGAGFTALIFAGVFGDPRQATLFHDRLDGDWLTSILTLAYPFLLLCSVPAIIILRGQLKRLRTIEGELSFATTPVITSATPGELRWQRIGATAYTVSCLLAAGSVGPALYSTNRPAVVALIAVTVTMLVLKWRIEHALTRRVQEWSNLSAQNSRMWLYTFFLIALSVSFFSGVIGGYIGAAAADDGSTQPPPFSASPELGLGLGTAMLAVPLWLGMMAFVTRQRVRLLQTLEIKL